MRVPYGALGVSLAILDAMGFVVGGARLGSRYKPHLGFGFSLILVAVTLACCALFSGRFIDWAGVFGDFSATAGDQA